VLSLGKLAPGQQQYYLDTVARGAEEYYTGGKEAQGRWLGAGAAGLGLEGEVTADALHRVLSHADPFTGESLTSGRSVPKVAGIDATFCAPKSVSLLFALAGPDIAREVRDAHDAAVDAAFAALEREATVGRRGHGGLRTVQGEGLVAAAFRHRTSRAAEPHLHTHVVIANLVRAVEDGRWTALDARPLYAWSRAAGHLYEAHLRYELTARLGVEWTPTRNGIADIEGIARPVIRAFSTRRVEIEGHLAEHGETSAKAAQVAAYATRRAKNDALDTPMLLDEWRTRAETHGLGTEALHAVLDRTAVPNVPAPGGSGTDELYRWLAGADGLTARRSTFTRQHVIEAICDALPGGATVEQVVGLVDDFLASDHAIVVPGAGELLHGRNGIVIPAGAESGRWTTPDMIRVEHTLICSALDRIRTGVAIADPEHVTAAIAARPTLSAEQVAMIERVCRSGDGVDVVVGVAGAGKTFALAAAHEAWTAAGYDVVGASLAARTAARLQEGSGIPSMTIDRLLAQLDRGGTLGSNSVLVIDEAAMVGTRKLQRVLDHAELADVKVVLVGDPCQLPEIYAGGAFAGLAQRLEPITLTDNQRQHEGWERDALAELRHGDTDHAFDAYSSRGRVHEHDDSALAREQLIDDWWNARLAGQRPAMIASHLRNVDDLNRRARARLQDAGLLPSDGVELSGRSFAIGDQVLALRNDYRIGILNGTIATIHEIDIDRQQLRLATDDHRIVDVPFAYADDGHLAHAYAMTIHKAQGATVDRALILADDSLTREHGYTALSRATDRNDLYLAVDDLRVEERHANETVTEPTSAVRHALRRSAAQHLAIDQGELHSLLAALPAPDNRSLNADASVDLPEPTNEREVSGVELDQ
jgi:conjugative relaxase-like TrwC/TraI family protein